MADHSILTSETKGQLYMISNAELYKKANLKLFDIKFTRQQKTSLRLKSMHSSYRKYRKHDRATVYTQDQIEIS